ncbi:hypothetical protein [Pseudomonas sp.]|uniref:hypothetical protein n=1 Tax=Pseudomonas sp. TaxID=306 RepID=UPI00290DCA1C|nr:hypothetical protein [Pseudomonas sp.]MDU4254499.1 hypothetical protein [Pseudomonas sp.]
MSKSPPVIDAEVFMLRMQESIEQLRQKMMLSPAPNRHQYYGMALGMLSALRQAELISAADFDARCAALTSDLGADG